MNESSDPVTRLNAALEGRYRVESDLGQVTPLTRHERKVALKVLKPELAALGNCGSAGLDLAVARAQSCRGVVDLGTTRAG